MKELCMWSAVIGVALMMIGLILGLIYMAQLFYTTVWPSLDFWGRIAATGVIFLMIGFVLVSLGVVSARERCP